VGVNVTLTVQLPPGVTPALQLSVSANAAGRLILLTESVVLPLLVTVTVWAGLVVFKTCTAKVRVEGEKEACACRPTPVKLTVCGLSGALSTTVTAPV